MFAFFTGSEVEKYFYYKVPQLLFTDDKFIDLSCEAKLLYGILLDRCSLSKKYKWVDDDGKIYVFFKQSEACEKLRFGKNKAIRIFDELEKIGLILRKKQGQGKPTKIYVCNFSSEVEQTSSCCSDEEVKTPQNRESEQIDIKEEVKTPQNRESKRSKMGSLPSYSMNQPNITNNQSIYREGAVKQTSEIDGWTDGQQAEIEADVKEQIEYEALLSQGVNRNTLDLIVDIITEAHNPLTAPCRINGRSLSPQTVIRQYDKLDSSHIEYVLESVLEVSGQKKIKDLRSYLRTSLYNAPHTKDLHYENEVNFDFHNKQ